MNVRNIFFVASAALALTACEDFTEKYFGSDDELWQATQVNTHTVTLTDANYADIANNAENQALALAADDDSATYRDLLSVAEKKYLRGNITAAEYLPALLKNLVGSSQYNAMTAGSSITVIYRSAADTTVSTKAYLPTTTIKSGSYLLVPQGETQVLANSNNAETGATYSYGYIYLSGTTRCPGAVTHLSDEVISDDDNASQHLYNLTKEDDHYLILNPVGQYLYCDDSHNSLQYTNDLGDLDDGTYAQWNITANADGSVDIENVATNKLLLYGTTYSSAGVYADKKGTDGYANIQLYALGNFSDVVDGSVEEQEITFTLDEDGVWAAKGDYINQTLLSISSTDADEIFNTYGWIVEYVGSIGDLSYVWNASTSYGLRASAYKNSTYYPTDAWMISPALNLKKASKPVFTFDEAQKYAGSPLEDYLQIWVSTDYEKENGVSAATWVNVTDKLVGALQADGTPYERPDGSSWNYSTMTLDLGAYAGQPNVRVAFRYISTETVSATWEVKNVVCREQEDDTEE